MPRALNKHGFPGVFKHTGSRHARKPFYTRTRRGCDVFVSRHFATAEEAAAEYRRMKMVPAVDSAEGGEAAE
jgi:hypothetical protein